MPLTSLARPAGGDLKFVLASVVDDIAAKGDAPIAHVSCIRSSTAVGTMMPR